MKVYLGDAVYAEFDGWGITLTTEDGVRATNRIYLEPTVLAELYRFRESVVDDYAPAGMSEAATLDLTSEPDQRITGTLAHDLADAAADRLDDDRREAQEIALEQRATRGGED